MWFPALKRSPRCCGTRLRVCARVCACVRARAGDWGARDPGRARQFIKLGAHTKPTTFCALK